MRHRKTTKKLSRLKDHRMSLLRNLSTTFALSSKLLTTTPKAKAMVQYYERIISLANRKNDEVHAIRVAKRFFYTLLAQKAFVKKLPDLKSASGHLRMTKIGFRKGDGGETTLVQYV